jgi:hypothetical protein
MEEMQREKYWRPGMEASMPSLGIALYQHLSVLIIPEIPQTP